MAKIAADIKKQFKAMDDDTLRVAARQLQTGFTGEAEDHVAWDSYDRDGLLEVVWHFYPRLADRPGVEIKFTDPGLLAEGGLPLTVIDQGTTSVKSRKTGARKPKFAEGDRVNVVTPGTEDGETLEQVGNVAGAVSIDGVYHYSVLLEDGSMLEDLFETQLSKVKPKRETKPKFPVDSKVQVTREHDDTSVTVDCTVVDTHWDGESGVRTYDLVDEDGAELSGVLESELGKVPKERPVKERKPKFPIDAQVMVLIDHPELGTMDQLSAMVDSSELVEGQFVYTLVLDDGGEMSNVAESMLRRPAKPKKERKPVAPRIPRAAFQIGQRLTTSDEVEDAGQLVEVVGVVWNGTEHRYSVKPVNVPEGEEAEVIGDVPASWLVRPVKPASSRSGGPRARLLSDEIVREIRSKRETEGLSAAKLAKWLEEAHGIKVTGDLVRSIYIREIYADVV